MWLLTSLTLFLCDLNVNFLFCTDVVLGCERSLQACSSRFLPPVVFSGSAVNDLDSRWFFGSTLFFFGDCISPLCVMKFTHILKAWLAYILYWHSGNMFPLSLFIYLSFPLSLSLCTLLSLSPRPPPPLCVCVALWSSAVLFSVIFIGATRGRHIAAIIYSKEKKTHTSPQTAGFFFFLLVSFLYIFTAQLSLDWSPARRRQLRDVSRHVRRWKWSFLLASLFCSMICDFVLCASSFSCWFKCKHWCITGQTWIITHRAGSCQRGCHVACR